MLSSNKNKISRFFKSFKKGQIKIPVDLNTKLVVYACILTFFIFYQFNILSYITFDTRTAVFVFLGLVWLSILSSLKTGHVLGYRLTRKATSRAILYLFVITFFILYYFFFSSPRLIFAASTAYKITYSCAYTAEDCSNNHCNCSGDYGGWSDCAANCGVFVDEDCGESGCDDTSGAGNCYLSGDCHDVGEDDSGDKEYCSINDWQDVDWIPTSGRCDSCVDTNLWEIGFPCGSNEGCSGTNMDGNNENIEPNCCGDDTGETKRTCSGTINQGSCDSDDVCCDSSNDCEWGNNCSSSGNCYTTGSYKSYCNSGSWEDPDSSETGCTATGCGFAWCTGSAGTNRSCCADDDAHETWDGGSDGDEYCCAGSEQNDDTYCSSTYFGWEYDWQVDGSQCTDIVYDGGSTSGTTISGDDINCSLDQHCANNAYICDGTDSGGAAEGVCVDTTGGNTYTCDTDEVCYTGSEYRGDCSSCSEENTCNDVWGTSGDPQGICIADTNNCCEYWAAGNADPDRCGSSDDDGSSVCNGHNGDWCDWVGNGDESWDATGSGSYDYKCDDTDNHCILCHANNYEQNHPNGVTGDGKCELACGANTNCDEKSIGEDLQRCDLTGQTYFEDECSSSCGLQDKTSVCECSETGCTCNSTCDGITPNKCGVGDPPGGYCNTCVNETGETSAEGCRCMACGTQNGDPGTCTSSHQGETHDPYNSSTWLGDVNEKCCGDESNEYYTNRSCYSGVCSNSSLDIACCDSNTDCVYNGVCHAHGSSSDVDGDGWDEECSNTNWIGLPPKYSLNNTNTTTPCTGDAVLIYANWTDDVDLNISWLWTNETGGSGKNYTTDYDSPVDINLTDGETWSNFTWQNSSITGGTVIAWKIYANDSSGNENVTGQGTFTVTSSWLEVSLVTPTAGSNTNVAQNSTFTVNATVYCRGCSCGSVNGTVRYNGSSSNPDTPINTTTGDKPFFINETSPKAMKECPTNPLSQDEFCNITWTVNATGAIDSVWKIGVLFNSSTTGINDNHTNNATITIGIVESIKLSWTSITFPNLAPNTAGNNATNNDQGGYNITNDGTCTLQTWIKGTDLTNKTVTPTPSTITVGNISYSNSTNDYSTSTRMITSYALIGPSHTANTNITTYYWFDVPIIYSGNYTGNVTICGNCTGTLCE